jgi:hypothetical protein
MGRKKKPTLLEQAERLSKHTIFCCWVHRWGYYDKTLGCTCGRDAFLRELKEVKHVD